MHIDLVELVSFSNPFSLPFYKMGPGRESSILMTHSEFIHVQECLETSSSTFLIIVSTVNIPYPPTFLDRKAFSYA